jgi:hypothetical protein
MFENLKITLVTEKRVSDDIFSRSRKMYCRLSEPVNTSELDREQWECLLDAVIEQLDIFVKTHCAPGQFFASVPSIHAHNRRMIVYQYAGYDV